jgi:hypothetical protein
VEAGYVVPHSISGFTIGGNVGFLLSNLMLKILIGLAIIGSVVYEYEKPPGDVPCVSISHFPNKSDVFECPKGLSTVVLTNSTGKDIFTTLTTSARAEAWLTVVGDDETVKTLRTRLGAPVILAPGAFMAVSTGKGLVYINAPEKYLLTVVWNHQTH